MIKYIYLHPIVDLHLHSTQWLFFMSGYLNTNSSNPPKKPTTPTEWEALATQIYHVAGHMEMCFGKKEDYIIICFSITKNKDQTPFPKDSGHGSAPCLILPISSLICRTAHKEIIDNIMVPQWG